MSKYTSWTVADELWRHTTTMRQMSVCTCCFVDDVPQQVRPVATAVMATGKLILSQFKNF